MKSENVTIKKEYCPNCFNAIGSMRPCPYCGNEQFDRKNPLALPVNVVDMLLGECLALVDSELPISVTI